jgi:hypothetical protein
VFEKPRSSDRFRQAAPTEDPVKYSPGDIHLSAALDDTGNQILFTVSDEGNGVPPDFVAHLFDRFTQAGQTGPRTGAGFGLYLSKLLAEANNGQVWYENVVPHGSRFMLRLPRSQRSPQTAAPLDPVDGDDHLIPDSPDVRGRGAAMRPASRDRGAARSGAPGRSVRPR